MKLPIELEIVRKDNMIKFYWKEHCYAIIIEENVSGYQSAYLMVREYFPIFHPAFQALYRELRKVTKGIH